MWDELVSMGYSSPTDTVLKALNLLITNSQQTPVSLDVSELKVRVEEKDTRIKELQEHIKIKDSQQEIRASELQDQLKVKDNQIEKLTETMHAQSIHIQTLINQKAIEAPGIKKPWYKFW